MKQYARLFLFASVFLTASTSFAHGPDSLQGGRAEILTYIEDRILGDATHEEVEELLVKIFIEAVTEEEALRFAELLKEEPGAVSLMTERFFEIEAEKKSLIENKDGGNIFTSQYWWVVLVLSFVAGFGGGVFARRSIKLKTYE